MPAPLTHRDVMRATRAAAERRANERKNMTGRDLATIRAEGGQTTVTREKLKEIWMTHVWAGPSERYDAERAFDELWAGRYPEPPAPIVVPFKNAVEVNGPGAQSWELARNYTEQAVRFLNGSHTSDPNPLGAVGNLGEAAKYADFAGRGI